MGMDAVAKQMLLALKSLVSNRSKVWGAFNPHMMMLPHIVGRVSGMDE